MERPGVLLYVSFQACHGVENLSTVRTGWLSPTCHVLVDPSVRQQGRFDGECPRAVGTLVRSLLGVNPNMSDEIARLLELPVAECAGIEPDPLLQPGPHQVLSHLPILQTISQDHLAMLVEGLALLPKSSGGTCDCGLDCAGKKIAVLLSSCLNTTTRNMVMDSLLNPRLIDEIIVTHVKAFWFTVWVKARDVCIQTSQAFEHTCALLALESFIPVKVMHPKNVSSQVSSL